MEEKTITYIAAGHIRSHPENPDEEKAEYEKRRDSIGFLHKLLVYAASAVEGKDLAEWNAGYHKGNGKLVMRLDEILSLFGFSYSREEFYRLAEGTHGLFMEG